MTAVAGEATTVTRSAALLPPIAPKRVWQARYVRRLRLTDTAIVIFAVFAAQWLRFGDVPGSKLGLGTIDYTAVSIVVAAVWLWFLSVSGTRSRRHLMVGNEEYRRVVSATLAAFGTIAILSMLMKLDIARGYLAFALPLGMVLLLLNRYIARRYVERKRRGGQYLTSVVLMGDRGAVTSLGRALSREPRHGYTIVGACLVGNQNVRAIEIVGVGLVPVYPDGDGVAELIAVSGADTLALTATESMGSDRINRLSWELESRDVDLVVAPGVVDVAAPRIAIQPVAGLPLIHVEKPQYDGAKRFLKRTFDLIFASTALLVISPVLAVTAIAIKVTSRGPVLYRSERIGLNGKPFMMIKFRSMVDGADSIRARLEQFNEADSGVLFKMRSDPRVTPLGFFIRRYSIDELPQLINVLRREMSLVGPRPPLPREIESYDERIRRRLLVPPGITGLWQVSGRSDLSWEDSVRLDLSYVENWNMLSDVMIIAATVKAVLGGKGAY